MPADAFRSLSAEDRAAWMNLSPGTRQAILNSTPKKSPTSVNLHDMSAADYFSQEHQVDLASVSAADFIRNISVNETDSTPSGPPDPGTTPSPPREANVTRRDDLCPGHILRVLSTSLNKPPTPDSRQERQINNTALAQPPTPPPRTDQHDIVAISVLPPRIVGNPDKCITIG